MTPDLTLWAVIFTILTAAVLIALVAASGRSWPATLACRAGFALLCLLHRKVPADGERLDRGERRDFIIFLRGWKRSAPEPACGDRERPS